MTIEIIDLKKRFQLLFNLTNTKNLNELDYYLLKVKKKAKIIALQKLN